MFDTAFTGTGLVLFMSREYLVTLRYTRKWRRPKNFTFSLWVFGSNVRSSLLRYDTRKLILLTTSWGSSLPPSSRQSKKRQYLLRKVSTYIPIFTASYPRPMILHHHCCENFKTPFLPVSTETEQNKWTFWYLMLSNVNLDIYAAWIWQV
jgi:hypothetical protein